jgi:uncharacterized protein (DUF2225 family)
VERTDLDLRVHYKGVEPLYYDVVTCPNCLYSALEAMFDFPDKPRAELLNELSEMKPRIQFKPGSDFDSYSVFAGHYLALHCAPKSFSKPGLATAKLLLNLSRIYADCGDGDMEEKTAKQALDAYLHAYENMDLNKDQFYQLCVTIGNLSIALDDFNMAKNFFFRVKTSRDCAPVLKRQAEDRLYAIHELERSMHEKVAT